MPLEKYANTDDRVAMGDADGMARKVFPHLGIDVSRINAVEDISGTFNVFNYNRKVNEAIPHQKVDLDFLIAGISLPMVLPPVRKDDQWYLDSAFVRDSNLLEAVRRGAEELWVVLCLGNTGEYRGGLLNLYAQMLEMSAVGALHQEFEQINEINQRIQEGWTAYGQTRPIKLHLIRPEYPLPLDPDLYLGRIDSSTLVDMGYADARRYLDNLPEKGLPFQPETSRMKDTRPGITFRETLTGRLSLEETDPKTVATDTNLSGDALSLRVGVNIRDVDGFIAGPRHTGELVGHLSYPPFGDDLPVHQGSFEIASSADNPKRKQITYAMAFKHADADYYLHGLNDVHDGPGFDLWQDISTLYITLHQGQGRKTPVVGAGVLTLQLTELVRLASTFHATNCRSVAEQPRILGQFGRFFLGELWDAYVSRTNPRPWWKRLLFCRRR
jgi:hypothetical protein